jgi:hypothetical protein
VQISTLGAGGRKPLGVQVRLPASASENCESYFPELALRRQPNPKRHSELPTRTPRCLSSTSGAASGF